MSDARRAVPRTDVVLADPRLQAAAKRLGPGLVKRAVRAAQAQARQGALAPGEVVAAALATLPTAAATLRPVLNATGVVLHTNLGRAPMSAAAVLAAQLASGYVDIEFDLVQGARSTRGQGVLNALRAAVPEAEACLVTNNGAAALVLATTALAAGREVVVSRGELVEIGDGFRLPDLIASTGARLREVGTTNRTTAADYAAAVGSETGCILKVHPSNFRIEGFTASASIAELARLDAPIVADLGSGLLDAHPLLPSELDVRSALRQGATVVTCSGDKLLGGPQAGLVMGDETMIQRLRRHPLYRAFRCNKTTLASLEATLNGPKPPVWEALEADSESLRRRADALAAALPADVAEVVQVVGAVGGGGAPGLPLPGWAVALPEHLAPRLRTGDPAVVARVAQGRTLVDLRCIPPADDATLIQAVLACMS